MFSSIRRAWYQHQDRKVAKKYEPKVKKTKNKGVGSGGSVDKKPIIILSAVVGIIILTIIGALIFNSTKSKKDNKKTTKIEVESEMTTELESITEETESLPVYTDEPTEEPEEETEINIPDYDSGGGSDVEVGGGSDIDLDGGSNVDVGGGGGAINPKPYKPKKKKKKANNKVPSQHERNVIGGSKVSLIKNSVRNCVGGVSNSNMKNLAIYLSNNGSSACNSALKNLCGYTTLKAGCKKATVKIPSNSKEDVSNATVKICNKLSGSYGKHGIGVSSYFNGSKYVINVVVAYQK